MNGKEAGKKNSVVPLGIKMVSDGNQNPVFVHDETSGEGIRRMNIWAYE